ncbi:hypothetical protein EOJ36_09255 [Sandaracinomonas limnophila]|uniref:Spore coat protein CotH n=1 Tax=Sandaracinomonas limnophila TaxID=1862386 RepID=A0A437PPA4_9BACT|nr:CotH kinase family protein [Sandaracinomonas limnophila]RVU24105.1 hypothetical protein EOJ36_09255 [Sandaracinomonas limnophila]
MKRILVFCFLILISCKQHLQVEVIDTKASDGQVLALETGKSTIPYFVINTQGNEILYGTKSNATLKVYQQKNLLQKQNITLKFRGKTSFRLSDKKSYNVGTVDEAGKGFDVSMLGLPAEQDWRLIGHVVNLIDKYIWDKTLMYNYIGYELSRKMGKYASRGQLVEVEINGSYQGVYLFCEKLNRSTNRINIKSMNSSATNITGGYILKIDKVDSAPENDLKPNSYFLSNWADDATYNEYNSFRSNYDINKNLLTFPPFLPAFHPNKYLETYFTYEYPSAEKITPAQKVYISKYLDQFEMALITDDFSKTTRTYTNFIDIDSFVDYFIITELCRNVDAYRLSTYVTKDADGKLVMGPTWDLNIGFDEGGRVPINEWVANYNNFVSSDAWMAPFWWTRLLEDPIFKQKVKARWQGLRSAEFSTAAMTQLVENTAQSLITNGAVARNYAIWDKEKVVNYTKSVEALKLFLENRSGWMDQKINGW